MHANCICLGLNRVATAILVCQSVLFFVFLAFTEIYNTAAGSPSSWHRVSFLLNKRAVNHAAHPDISRRYFPRRFPACDARVITTLRCNDSDADWRRLSIIPEMYAVMCFSCFHRGRIHLNSRPPHRPAGPWSGPSVTLCMSEGPGVGTTVSIMSHFCRNDIAFDKAHIDSRAPRGGDTATLCFALKRWRLEMCFCAYYLGSVARSNPIQLYLLSSLKQPLLTEVPYRVNL